MGSPTKSKGMAAGTDVMDVSSMRFLTGSSFEGSWNQAVHMMDGFGSYRYPDGTEYRGRFVDGKFHGFGQLKLAQPYRFTIKGEFKRGKLVCIEDMWFNDGLHVQGSFKDDKFNCEDWDYLSPMDRRYQAERFYGQQPVGPTAYLTSALLARPVPVNSYDAEEGIYDAETGWLVDRSQPFSKNVYISCPDERHWIMRNCRGERKEIITEPLPSFCRKIILNNLEAEQAQLKKINIYAPKNVIDRARCYPKICRQKGQAEQKGSEAKRPPFVSKTTTEHCLQDHYQKEQQHAEDFAKIWKRDHPREPMPHIERARQWTSSSEAISVDSGATRTISESPSEVSLRQNVQDVYETAYFMTQKPATGSLYVVQSNMQRPTSFMDVTHSEFQL